jgi:GNAT superfamily N-acetyltransferase
MQDLLNKKLHFFPATPDRWKDIEALFGERGACGGCWCMAWRLSASEFDENKGEKNRTIFCSIVKKGTEPGVLAYAGGEPVGWCAVGPREDYPRLERSKVWARLDDQPVWSITCLFVKKPFRNRGLSAQLIEAAAKLAKKQGVKIVEGYPQELKGKRLPDAFVWTGLSSAFLKAGFQEVARRSDKKPMMRKTL